MGCVGTLSLLLLFCSSAAGVSESTSRVRLLAQHAVSAPTRTFEKFAFYKTHKTASTSLSAVAFRFGARHGLRMYARGNTTEACGGPKWTVDCDHAHTLWPLITNPRQADMVLHHMSHGTLEHSFSHLLDWYQRVLGPRFLTIVPVRKPSTRFVSWFNFFVRGKPEEGAAGASLAAWVESGRGANGFSAEFGVKSSADAEALVQNMTGAWRGADPARRILWLPMERFEDAVLMLGHHAHWTYMDLLNDKLFENSNAPKDVQAELAARIEAQCVWDNRIYDAALRLFEEDLAELKAATNEKLSWSARSELLQQLQTTMHRSFDAAWERPSCAVTREWYTMGDLQYEGQINPDTFMASVPHETVTATMLRALGERGIFC